MDPITALLGLGTEDEQATKALADTLRGRQQAADMFAISTIPQIAQGAQNEQKSILEAAKRGGSQRQQALQRAMYKKMQDERLAAQAETQANRLSALKEAAAMEPQSPTMTYTQPKTKAERTKFDLGATHASNLIGLQDTFKDDYAIQKGDVPWTGNITNWLGRTVEGIAPEDWGEKAQWWSNYKNHAELVERHELFGSALTRTEQSEWAKATITPNDGPKYIREKLKTRARLAKKVAEADAARALQKGYDPDQVLMNYGDVVDVDALAPRVEDGSYFEELAERQNKERQESPLTNPAAVPTMEDAVIDNTGQDAPEYVRFGTNEKGQRVGQLPDGTVEVIE